MPGGEPGNDRYTSSHLVSLESPRPAWLRRRECMATAMNSSFRSTMVTPITPPTLDSGPSSIHCRVDARWLQARKELGETPRPTSWSVALPRHCVQLLPLQHRWLASQLPDSCSCSTALPVALGPICLSSSTTARFCTCHAYWWKSRTASYRDDEAAASSSIATSSTLYLGSALPARAAWCTSNAPPLIRVLQFFRLAIRCRVRRAAAVLQDAAMFHIERQDRCVYDVAARSPRIDSPANGMSM